MTGKHSSVVGSSTAKLRLLCNASIDESQGVPEEPWNIYAATGTALHKVMEDAIAENWSKKTILREFVGRVIEDVTLTGELIETKAFTALDIVDDIIPPKAIVTTEQYLRLPEVHKEAGGTGDVIFDDPDDTGRCGVIDYKFGDGVIVAEDGAYQIKFVLAAAIMRGKLPAIGGDFRYEGYIVQPSAKLDPSQYVTQFEFTLAEIRDFIAELHDAVNSARNHNAGSHCYGCKGKVRCKAYQAMLGAAMATDLQTVDTHTLGALLDLVPSINKFVSEIKEHAKRNADAGKIPVGYKIETALGDRIWKDEEAAWGALGRLGLDANTRTKRATISPAQAEKALKSIEADPKQVERMFRRHVIRPENGTKLVKLAKGEIAADDFMRLGLALEAAK